MNEAGRATRSPEGHAYDDRFYDYINDGSRRSAVKIVPVLMGIAQPRSVLDVGCGAGAWLSVWGEALEDWAGVDGEYVDPESLLIPPRHFEARDLSEPFDLGRRFDLVCSFEVAEHIDRSRSDLFVDSLCRHGDVIAFSAATPGQGGEHHVNEQPYGYWRTKFAARGYACYDAVRPAIAKEAGIEPWYRYNILLFANGEGDKRLSPKARATRLAEQAPVRDVSPVTWRARRTVLRLLPRPVIEVLAQAAHNVALAKRR